MGLGLRAAASAEDIAQALAGLAPCGTVAVPADKADHPGLCAAAARGGFAIVPVDAARLADAGAGVVTHSPRIARLKGVGSVAEAAALAAAGPGARLVVPRIVAAEGRVTVAVAEGP